MSTGNRQRSSKTLVSTPVVWTQRPTKRRQLPRGTPRDLGQGFGQDGAMGSAGRRRKKEEGLVPQAEEDAAKKTPPLPDFKPAESAELQLGADTSSPTAPSDPPSSPAAPSPLLACPARGLHQDPALRPAREQPSQADAAAGARSTERLPMPCGHGPGEGLSHASSRGEPEWPRCRAAELLCIGRLVGSFPIA